MMLEAGQKIICTMLDGSDTEVLKVLEFFAEPSHGKYMFVHGPSGNVWLNTEFIIQIKPISQ